MLTDRQKEELALIAMLHEGDIVRAPATWDRLAPRGFRGLLNAPTSSAYSAPASGFWWDPNKAQFAIGRRGYVPTTAIRTAINAFNDAHGRDLAALSLATIIEEGGPGLSVAQWEAGMERGIKSAQIINAAVGRGGIEALTAPDIEVTTEAVKYQLGRLERFVLAVENDEVERTGAALRAAAYAKSAVSTYDGMRRIAAGVANMTLERNILGVAEHCRARPQDIRPDCPSLTRKGWVLLGTLTRIGERLCLWNCKCHMEFRRP